MPDRAPVLAALAEYANSPVTDCAGCCAALTAEIRWKFRHAPPRFGIGMDAPCGVAPLPTPLSQRRERGVGKRCGGVPEEVGRRGGAVTPQVP